MKLPDGWNLERLEELAKFSSGGTPNKNRADFWGGEFPWVTAKDLKSLIIKESLDHLTNEGFKNAKITPENSILILVRGMTLHKDVPVCLTSRPVAFNQDIKALVCSKTILPIYLVLYLRFQKSMLLDLVDSAGHGTGRIDTDLLKNFQIKFPPLQSQKAIADLLATWDEAIEKTERLIQAKEQHFKWLLSSLINKQCNVKCKKVKLGELFGKEIQVEKGKTLTKESKSDGKIPVVAGGQSYAYYTNIPTHEIPTVTISASGASAGFAWFHDYPIWASDCNVLYAIMGSTRFLYFALKTIQHKIYALQSGGAQPHVYSKDMENLFIPWPAKEIQEKIAETLFSVRLEIDLLKELAEKYKFQKRGLMQKLLTGQWRINEYNQGGL